MKGRGGHDLVIPPDTMSERDPRDNVSRMIGRLMRGPKVVVASPEFIKKELERGGPVQFIPDKPLPEAIKELFEDRKKHAHEIASKLIPCPLHEPIPLVVYFYDQIRACILFKLHSLAITLCGTMVESCLKYCSYSIESSNLNEFDPNLWDTFERDDFGKSIERARKNGLLDDKTEPAYRTFKNNFRNPYAHFNIQKLTKGVTLGKVEVFNAETGETQIEDIPANRMPAFQMIALEKMDATRVLEVFDFADRLVQHLFVQVVKLVDLDEAV